MDLAQGGGRLEGDAVVDLDVVGEVQLFEEPQDALGAGLVQPVVVSACKRGRRVVGAGVYQWTVIFGASVAIVVG